MHDPVTPVHVPLLDDPMLDERRASIRARLGLNVPAGWWASRPTVKEYEAAGFALLQIHSPPGSVLLDSHALGVHADAVRDAIGISGLRLVLHAPDDLSGGTSRADLVFQALLDYASRAGAELVVYHGANFPADGSMRTEDRLLMEERSLRRFARRAERLGVTIAVENLAPVYPGPPRLCHDPRFVHRLVSRIASERVKLCFDVGHANITAALREDEPSEYLAAVADCVAVFHVHDNLGARTAVEPRLGFDPLKLDLHLPPGGGTVPWPELGPALLAHSAPLILEVHPPHRPDPMSAGTLTAELLVRVA